MRRRRRALRHNSYEIVDPFLRRARTARMKKLQSVPRLSLHKETIAVLDHLVLREVVAGLETRKPPAKTEAYNCFSKHPFGECF